MSQIEEKELKKVEEFLKIENCQHNFKFSHYENGDPNSTYLRKYAIRICKNCGEYRRQDIF